MMIYTPLIGATPSIIILRDYKQTDLRVNIGKSLHNMLDGTFKLFLTEAGWTGSRISTRLKQRKKAIIKNTAYM